jgi:hypothetical protein
VKYSVGVYDCAGEFTTREVDTFEECLSVVAEFSRLYPDKVVCAANLDRCDYDTDGLTEDEREAIELVVFQ